MTKPCPRCRKECEIDAEGHAVCSAANADLGEWVRLHRPGEECWWCELGVPDSTVTDLDGVRQRTHKKCGREACMVGSATDLVLDTP